MKRLLDQNVIRYQGRHIRHCPSAFEGNGVYIVSWSANSSDRQAFYGTLEELIRQIDETIAFWGRWEFLI